MVREFLDDPAVPAELARPVVTTPGLPHASSDGDHGVWGMDSGQVGISSPSIPGSDGTCGDDIRHAKYRLVRVARLSYIAG